MADKDDVEPPAPDNDPAGAANKPAEMAKGEKARAREDRLTEALRANLRRRKQATGAGVGAKD